MHVGPVLSLALRRLVSMDWAFRIEAHEVLGPTWSLPYALHVHGTCKSMSQRGAESPTWAMATTRLQAKGLLLLTADAAAANSAC